MLKQVTSLLLAIALGAGLMGPPTVQAKSKAEKEAARAIQVKANIAKLGSGPAARVTVKLRDKRKLAGYIE